MWFNFGLNVEVRALLFHKPPELLKEFGPVYENLYKTCIHLVLHERCKVLQWVIAQRGLLHYYGWTKDKECVGGIHVKNLEVTR